MYTITKWETMPTAQMSKASGPNVLDGAGIHKIHQGIEQIKSDAENSSKIVDENGEPIVAYHGSGKKSSPGPSSITL